MIGLHEWRLMWLRRLFSEQEFAEIDEEQARINTAPLTNAHGERERLVTVLRPGENGDLPDRFRP